ncbi:MAG TPA: SRPBCC family protein [Solirubrobacteraceae bacterium]|nr:SRPBCC family protein [Solirubrobacteraceae bacterium]
MRVQAQIEIAAPRGAVWELVTDPERYLHFMAGMTRWEVAGDRATGLGARYRTLMRVGSAEIGGLVEVVEWDEERDLAWSSVTGVDQRGRWRLRAGSAGPDSTRVELRLAYGVAGSGILGWVAEVVAAPTVRGHLRRSLQQLKRQVEHEQLRRQAAARRSGAGVSATSASRSSGSPRRTNGN